MYIRGERPFGSVIQVKNRGPVLLPVLYQDPGILVVVMVSVPSLKSGKKLFPNPFNRITEMTNNNPAADKILRG